MALREVAETLYRYSGFDIVVVVSRVEDVAVDNCVAPWQVNSRSAWRRAACMRIRRINGERLLYPKYER